MKKTEKMLVKEQEIYIEHELKIKKIQGEQRIIINKLIEDLLSFDRRLQDMIQELSQLNSIKNKRVK